MKQIGYIVLLLTGACASVPSSGIDCNQTPKPAACNPAATPTPTPTPSPNPDPRFETISNLELYAKISSNKSAAESDLKFRSINVADTYVTSTANNNNGAYQVWSPGRCEDASQASSAELTFVWSTPVEINSIDVYNASVKDPSDTSTIQQVKGGTITFFEESTSTAVIAEIDMGELDKEDKAKNFKPVLSKKPKMMKIKILNAVGKCAGISEVSIIGTRQVGDFKNQDAAPFSSAYTKDGVTSVSSTLDSLTDIGVHRSLNIKDGLSSTSWRSNGNGTNAFVTFRFDQPYCLSSILIEDGSQDGPRIGKGSVSIDGGSDEPITFSGGSATYSVPSTVLNVKSIKFRVTELTGSGSSNTGIKNIRLMTCP